MRILQLTSENIKRLKVVQITPSGELVVIGGRNGQGKSSVLDSIEMALGGKRSAPSKPVRTGEEEARIVCDLGDIIVRRTFSADGKTSLSVESKDGAIYNSPQTMLDKLVGRLSFDPLEFSRIDDGEQLDVLCQLVGLDLAKFDARRKEVFDERTAYNRGIKQLEGQLSGMVKHQDAPAAEVSITALSAELKSAQAAEKKAAAAQQDLGRKESALKECNVEIDTTHADIARLQARLLELEASAAAAKHDVIAQRDLRDQLQSAVPDIEAIHTRMANAEATNRKVRANAEHAALTARIAKGREASAVFTEQITAIDGEKRAAIAGAAFPVPGLSLGDACVTLNNLPFDQASSAEKLRVSVAIGLAMHPKLRVLLIRDGSLLDEEGLRLLGELAAAAKAQVWVERVSNGSEVSVVIEDGSVLGELKRLPIVAAPATPPPDEVDHEVDQAEAG